MRQILTFPNPILLKKSKPVKRIDSKIKSIVEEMIEMLGVKHHGEVPLAIAAPQIGELIRMFVYRKNPYSSLPAANVVVINPELVYAKGDVTLFEPCLSLPGKRFLVKRHKIVKLRGLGLNGALRSFKGRDIIAQLLDHELDHLDGILINKSGVIAPY